MNEKEIGEIRRRIRRDRSNITSIYGCYVNSQKELISEFKLGTGTMPENWELALAELKVWYSGGHRPMSSDYIYLSWSSKEILLRDTFEENKSTHYWRMR